MKHKKLLGLLTLATIALMAFAGPASAKLTEGTGDPVEASDVIHGNSQSGIEVDGTVDILCDNSTVGGTVAEAGGTSGPLHTLTLTECAKDTVRTIDPGVLLIANSGVLIWTGAEITVQMHRSVGGFPITTHCAFSTNNTVLGSFTESDRSQPHPTATLHIDSAQIPVDATTSDAACGSTVELTGSYVITKPHFLAVDTDNLTEGTGDPVESGDVIHATDEGEPSLLHGSFDVICQQSTVEGTVNAAGGATSHITALTFKECGKDTVTVISGGSLAVASNGTVRWSGSEVTVQVHRSILGFPITTHCTYVTNNTAIGTLTESDSSGHPTATFDIDSAQIPVDETTSADECGATAEWTASYLFTKPDFLAVD